MWRWGMSRRSLLKGWESMALIVLALFGVVVLLTGLVALLGLTLKYVGIA